MKTLILCIDALFSGDIGHLQRNKHFAPLFEHAVAVRNVQSIYPTLTYPCHASILSGVSPAKHRVIANVPLDPVTGNRDWYWYYSQIKARTVIDAMKEKGLTTSAIFWPVTADAPVDHLVPEIWSDEGDSMPVVKASSSHDLDDVFDTNREYLVFTDKRKQDTFGRNCALEIIARYNPDVMLLHFCLIDKARHTYGIHHPEVTRDLDIMGEFFGDLMDAVCAVQKESPTVVILGDHGHLNCTANLSMNCLFREKGWLDPATPADLRAYALGCGISSQVYLRDDSLRAQAEALFVRLKEEGYLRDIFTREQAAAMGLDGDFDYVLEAADGYSIVSDMQDSFVARLALPEGVEGFGNHGHLPTRGDKPPLIVSDARICGYREIDGASMLDIAPTLCRIHGLPLWEMEGSPIEAIASWWD